MMITKYLDIGATSREWTGYRTYSGLVLGSKYRLKGLIEPLRENHAVYRAESLLFSPSSAYEAHLFDLDEGSEKLRKSRVRNLKRIQARPSVVDRFRYEDLVWVVVQCFEEQVKSQAKGDGRRPLM